MWHYSLKEFKPKPLPDGCKPKKKWSKWSMHDAAASFPILHAMFFSLPLLLLTKMPIPQGVDETHLEAMSTEYEYYEGIPIQVLHTIQKANIRQIFNSHYCIFTIFFSCW